MGLQQRGRSRRFLDDHGWWLGDVTFEPGRNPGAYIWVGVTWMWDPSEDGHPGGWSFSERIRTRDEGEMIVYESDEQFAPLVRRYAALAADLVRRNREQLRDLRQAARTMSRRAVNRGQDVDAGVLWALAGEPGRARKSFARYTKYYERTRHETWSTGHAKRKHDRVLALLALLDDPAAFRVRIADEMRETRAQFELSPDAELPAA